MLGGSSSEHAHADRSANYPVMHACSYNFSLCCTSILKLVFAMDTSVQTRSQKISELTDLVYASLDLEYVRTTGSLFASKSLRHSATRQQMSFMKNFQYEGRLLTEKVTTMVVKNLLDRKSLEIPASTPGYSKRKWVKDSAQLLLSLLQKARRSYSAMDTMDTQPWQLDEAEDSVNRCHAARI